MYLLVSINEYKTYIKHINLSICYLQYLALLLENSEGAELDETGNGRKQESEPHCGVIYINLLRVDD